eukprot:3514663-Amphidinium_carterae.2
MQDLVRPETSEGYQRDAGWPLASLTIANVTKEQYDQLWVPTPPDVDMQQLTEEEEADAPFEEDVVFMNEEERVMMDSCAAAKSGDGS